MKYSISIVSHGSGRLIAGLFKDLCKSFPPDSEVILTINIPEDESYLVYARELPLKVIRNLSPMGFGANHNQAFGGASGEKFVIVNPDVRIPEAPWRDLDIAFDQDTGACAPLILSPIGGIEDSVRYYPTIARLLRRVVFHDWRPDYSIPQERTPLDVEWTAGIFVMFDSECYRAIKGFDARFFMYLEDADICRRLHKAGKKVLCVPKCYVVHDAQRASRKSWKHCYWHVSSAVRFILSL